MIQQQIPPRNETIEGSESTQLHRYDAKSLFKRTNSRNAFAAKALDLSTRVRSPLTTFCCLENFRGLF